MRRSTPLPLLALAFLAPGAPAGVHAPHPGSAACDRCHLGDAPASGGADLRASAATLCHGCHRDAVEGGHPVGVAARRPVAGALVLDAAGRLTCLTCHRVHGADGVALALPREALCLGCHDL